MKQTGKRMTYTMFKSNFLWQQEAVCQESLDNLDNAE